MIIIGFIHLPNRKFQVIFSGAKLVFFCHSGQQFAQQMQQQNPEIIEQLRSQMRSRPPSSAGNDEHWHSLWYHKSLLIQVFLCKDWNIALIGFRLKASH